MPIKRGGRKLGAATSSEDEDIIECAESSRRKIKHYSMVQNRPVYFKDLKDFENRIMLSIDIPRYFYLDPGASLSEFEVAYEQRMKD